MIEKINTDVYKLFDFDGDLIGVAFKLTDFPNAKNKYKFSVHLFSGEVWLSKKYSELKIELEQYLIKKG